MTLRDSAILPWHRNPSPENPFKHKHLKDPITFVQLAFGWHGRVWHSLLSKNGNFKHSNQANNMLLYIIFIQLRFEANWLIPKHLNPFPSKPSKQEHSKDPILLTHVALSWHGYFSHSFTSVKIYSNLSSTNIPHLTDIPANVNEISEYIAHETASRGKIK